MPAVRPYSAARLLGRSTHHHSSSGSSHGHALPTGAYIGIAVFIVLLIILLVFVVYKKRRSSNQLHFESTEDGDIQGVAYQTYRPETVGAGNSMQQQGAATVEGDGEMRYNDAHTHGGSTTQTDGPPPAAAAAAASHDVSDTAPTYTMPVPSVGGQAINVVDADVVSTTYPPDSKDPNLGLLAPSPHPDSDAPSTASSSAAASAASTPPLGVGVGTDVPPPAYDQGRM